MRIGLIARADSTGLGTQSKGFFDNIPCKALVIDFQGMAQPHDQHILKPHLERFPGQQVVKWGNRHHPRGDVPREIIQEFIKDIDILFCMETPYDYDIFDMCRGKVKTILQLNYEFLDFPNPNLTKPDLFAAPSMWNYDNIPNPKVYLPVPATPQPTIKAQNTFVHIAGRHAMHDRNGTQTLFQALNFVRSDITLIIRGQQDTLYVPNKRRANVKIMVDTLNKKDHLQNYESGGILVMPRKYGGLCLPMQEAISFGMPVIAPDISPNNTWLPREWLVPAENAMTIRCKRNVDLYETDPVALAQKIDDFCHPVVYDRAVTIAEDIRKTISWEALLPKYHETFNQCAL